LLLGLPALLLDRLQHGTGLLGQLGHLGGVAALCLPACDPFGFFESVLVGVPHVLTWRPRLSGAWVSCVEWSAVDGGAHGPVAQGPACSHGPHLFAVVAGQGTAA
jgi:hypothetical protein